MSSHSLSSTASEFAREAVSHVPAADPAAEGLVGFSVREGLEFLAPDNYLPTNPQLLEQTRREHGRNLVRGAQALAEDIRRTLKGLGPVGTRDVQGRASRRRPARAR